MLRPNGAEAQTAGRGSVAPERDADFAPAERTPGVQQLVLAREHRRELFEPLAACLAVLTHNELEAVPFRVQPGLARQRGVAATEEINHRLRYR